MDDAQTTEQLTQAPSARKAEQAVTPEDQTKVAQEKMANTVRI